MKTFNGLREGTVITNPVDGNMTVRYSDWFSENGKKELCFEDKTSLWAGYQFDPADWEVLKKET